MNIILGASGQVGSAVVKNLIDKKQAVKGIVRNEKQAHELKQQGAAHAIADANDLASLKKAFEKGDTVFVLTPETGKEENVLEETGKILDNYKKAIQDSSILKVVGLSSIGAQHDTGTGNLLMSYMLEHAFTNVPVQQIFIRPAYYFSNWLAYLDSAKESGVLPTFFPPDLSIEMISPQDVAKFASTIISDEIEGNKIYELTGPVSCNSNEVAATFSKVLRVPVKAQQIPRNEWDDTLRKIGFSEDGVKNFIEMTQSVIDKKTGPEGKKAIRIRCETTLETFLTTIAVSDKDQ